MDIIVDHKADREYWQLVWNKFKAGDSDALETIYNEFIDSLFAYGSKITSDRALLEDSIQDVFLDTYTYGKSLRNPEYLEFYLFKTLKHIIYKKFNEKKRFTSTEEDIHVFDLEFSIEDMDEKLLLEKRWQLLQNEIKKLDSKKRELLFLKFNSGLTNAEIGKLLDVKSDTVKKQVQRLIKYFKDKFESSLLDLFLVFFKK